MQKTANIKTLIEPQLEDLFKRLASKKGLTCSGLMRALIIDELQVQGMLPEMTAVTLLKGARA